MNMRHLGNLVTGRPVTTIIAILLITSIFGYYASHMEMSADLKTFLPEDDIVRAQEKISDEFGDTDIVQILIIANNTVTKGNLENMLKIEEKLENNETVRKYLKDPDHPENSIVSPADIVVMGNITLDFERTLISGLREMRGNLSQMNFSMMKITLSTMDGIVRNYRDIYNNATIIRDDAAVVVLLLFNIPTEANESESMASIMPLLTNITYALTYGENYHVKAMFLTLLTPPKNAGDSSIDLNKDPIFNYFKEDMNSTMGIGDKEISVRYLRKTNDYNYWSINYSYTSLKNAIDGNNQTVMGLNYVKNSIVAGNNATATSIINMMIDNVSKQENEMKKVLPYYQNFNYSLSKFLYHFKNGNVTQEDIRSVEENTTKMISVSSGDIRELLLIFNDTFHEWLIKPHIYYDMIYQANNTHIIAQQFIEGYDTVVKMNYTFNSIKGMINHDSVSNTTRFIDNVINTLNQTNAKLMQQIEYIEDVRNAMDSSYFRWFSRMLDDMDYILQNSKIAEYAINVFNLEMKMMVSSGTPEVHMDFDVFYSLKHAFESGVSDIYKAKIERMYLQEMAMATSMMGHNTNFTLNINQSGPEIKMPNFNMSARDKMHVLSNMSNEDIYRTIEKIENYNSTPLNNEINLTLPVVENTSGEMENITVLLKKYLQDLEFVYNTTGEHNVSASMETYKNISSILTNATKGMNYLKNNLAYMSGFSYMMSQFSEEFKNLFSKDYDGHHAKAALMIVMLNNTYLPGETRDQHSSRMEKAEYTVEKVAKSATSEVEIKAMGTYIISRATEKTANETMNVLLPVSMLLIVIILLITFRSAIDTILGLLGLGMAIVWAYGFGVMAGYSFNQISTMVAVLLVGLGIDYAIHTILRYREEIRKGNSVRGAMNEMITNLGMGLVLATITTIVAFLSNLSSPIPPIQSFGVMNAIGIFGAFIIFTTFVPGVKIIIDEHLDKKGKLKIRRDKKKEGSGLTALNNFLAIGAVGAEKHRYVVLLIVIVITGMAAYAGMNVNTSFDLKDFLPSNLEVSDTINYLMENFNGSEMNDNYILIEGNITAPSTLRAVDDTMRNIENDDYVNYAQSKSITTMITEWKEKNASFAKMVEENDTDGDGLPDRNITSIYDWLYENADGKNILHKDNGTYDSMLIVIRSSASTDVENKKLANEINKDIQPLKEAGLKATLTGTNILTFHILDLLGNSQWNSLIITIIVSFLVLTIVFYYEARSYILGIITSLPVVIALLWLMGSMYALGIGFNVVTVTITSLTIGLGITYAIHITHRFLEDLNKENGIENAVRKTVIHTGTSIFGAATTTMAGFGTLMLSSMPPISQFGEIAALSILYSFILSVFILPSFLYIWAEMRERRIITKENSLKFQRIGASTAITGIAIYLLAYYLRWQGWKVVRYPPAIAPALIGIIALIIGMEIYLRADGKI